MSSRATPAPIVVGVDSGGAAEDAVSWAAAEAASRRCPLRVVHAFHQPALIDPSGGLSTAEAGVCQSRVEAERTLREAVARSWSIAPDIEVSARLLFGTAVRALLGEASDARLLVLGNRGLGGVLGLLAGSVSIRVSARARCPVVVIHPSHPAEGVCPAWSPPRVVVGIDATHTCAPAIEFAFRSASQRGIGLTAVHAWSVDAPADLETIRGDPVVAEYAGLCAVERALECWRSDYPEVPVAIKVVHADPAQALIAESAGAALVVVGSRGRGHILGMLLGSVSQRVLHRAESPIAVVSDRCAQAKASRPWPAVTARERHHLHPMRRRKRA